MKPRLLLLFGLALGLVLFTYAQTSVNSTGKLESAVALIQGGKVNEARAILAGIGSKESAYPTARGLDALCLFQEDKRKFLDVMRAPEMQTLELPGELREELDYNQIDALFFYRKFEDILPKLADFPALHAGSARLQAVAEYQLAALYERGMKKLTESGFLQSRGDVAGAEKRMKEGQENLGRFLRLAAGGQPDGYRTLTNRDAPTELVKALTALGGEQEVLKAAAPAEREQTALAILQIYIKTQPEAVDENLRRMTNFLGEFPNNKQAPRVRYEMASATLERGWQIHFFDYKKFKRGAATPYFNKAHDMFSGVIVDKEAGIADADVMEARKHIMQIYYAKQDWGALSNWVAQNLANLPAGGKDWLSFKLYNGAGLACQMKSAEAAKELEEVLGTGFKGHPSYDGPLVSAAKWRIRVAKQSGDESTIQRIKQLVEESNCYGSVKRTFMAHFADLLAEPNLNRSK